MEQNHIFTRSDLEETLERCVGKTLLEVDSAHVLSSGKKNKGYPGAVIEQSVLGYPADNAQRPDLIVDGNFVELKTTGLKETASRKNSVSSADDEKKTLALHAKEPVSITAVQPESIVDEEFETSHFWEKCREILFVYYQYLSNSTDSKTLNYNDFPIIGFDFIDFDKNSEIKETLKNDWTIVRDYIREIQNKFPENPEEHYPGISTHLNHGKLAVIDTAPKWPSRPRFRLKRAFIDSLVQEYLSRSRHKKTQEKLNQQYTSLNQIDQKCHELTEKYAGCTVQELIDSLDIKKKTPSKADAEKIIVRMFGGKSTKMSGVEVFSRYGVIGKSVVINRRGIPVEDMKMFPIDFDELSDPDMRFDNSDFRMNFSESQLLFIVFEEESRDASFRENVFRGFKRFSFDEAFLEIDLKNVWKEMQNLILNDELEDKPVIKQDGTYATNRNGVVRTAPNWPKSANNIVFVRGSGRDSNDKPVVINGIHMYRQYLWLQKKYTAKVLNNLEYL